MEPGCESRFLISYDAMDVSTKEEKLMDLTNYTTLEIEEGKGKGDSKVFPLVVRGGILFR